MKVNQVKQFISSNISRFEKNGSSACRSFNLYDKNNLFRGEYNFIPLDRSGYLGVQTSLSSTRIMDDNRRLQMQEYVFMNKDYVTLKDNSSETLTKDLPKIITTTRTIMDFVKDKFITIRTTNKLKNNLQRIGENDPDFIYSDKFVIYESLKEKPQYEQVIETIREGSISEAKKLHSHFNSKVGVPFIYW